MKIIIFYSSIGQGHISAARAIEKDIKQIDANAIVVQKDIREFMSPLWRKIDERLYWFVVNSLPKSFDALFWNLQDAGNKAYSFASLPNDYPDKDVHDFIRKEDPQVIIATHYGSAQVLARLRENEQLEDVKIGWLHTDFFEGYFPRISMRLDCTFLGHSELTSCWLKAGVPQNLIIESGMPVNTILNDFSKEEIFARYNLKTTLPTVLIAGGKEGVCDYQGVINALVDTYDGHLQILALCGMNTRKQKALEQQALALQTRISVHVVGFIPHQDIVALMHASNLLVTKAGGMTPPEAFAIGLPTVLLDVIHGHEHENAVFFKNLGVALLAVDGKEVGIMIAQLLNDDIARQVMIQKQKQFSERSNFSAIAHFVLDNTIKPRKVLPDFGSEYGHKAKGTQEVLAQLDSEIPADFELLLSYATSQEPELFARENPFGHIAIRIGSIVFSANYLANPETGAPLLQKIELEKYLFGIEPPPGNQKHTNTYGMTYGRDTIGLRVKGMSENSLKLMILETEKIEQEYQAGLALWHLRDFNCAHVVVRILDSGECKIEKRLGVRGSYAMPFDVFDSALRLFQGNSTLSVNLVSYKKLIGSHAEYQYTHFPLSIGQPIRSLSKVMRKTAIDRIEESVIMLVANFGDDQLFIEKLSKGHSNQNTETRKQKRLKQALHEDLTQLFDLKNKLNIQKLNETLSNAENALEIRNLINQINEITRRATENAEELMPKQLLKKIRNDFSKFINYYGSLNESMQIGEQIKQYVQLIDEFHDNLISKIQEKVSFLKEEKRNDNRKKK